MNLKDFRLKPISDTEIADLNSGAIIDTRKSSASIRIARAIYNNYHLRETPPLPEEPFERLSDRDFTPLLEVTVEDDGWVPCHNHRDCATKTGIHVSLKNPSDNISLTRKCLHLNASWGWHSYIPSFKPIQATARLYIGGRSEPSSIARIVECLTDSISDRWRLKFSYTSMANRPDAVTIYMTQHDIHQIVSNAPNELRFLGDPPGFVKTSDGIAYAPVSPSVTTESFGWIKSKVEADKLLTVLGRS